MPENRNLKRHRKRLQIKYGANGSMRTGFTDDVSDAGFFIRTAVVYPPKTILKVELVSPANEVIQVVGMVRWAKRVPPNLLRTAKGGMGIRIEKFLSGEEAFRILCDKLNGK